MNEWTTQTTITLAVAVVAALLGIVGMVRALNARTQIDDLSAVVTPLRQRVDILEKRVSELKAAAQTAMPQPTTSTTPLTTAVVTEQARADAPTMPTT